MRGKKNLWAGAFFALLACAVAHSGEAPASDWKNFGKEFTLTASEPADKVLADPAAYDGKQIRIEGKVADVCSKKGCWMVISAGDKSLRVSMKDYSFFVPTDSTGATADLEGTIVGTAVTEEEAAHYAAEAAKPELAPKAGDKNYELVATAIRIKKG